MTNPDLSRTAPLADILGLSDNWWLFLLRGIAAIVFGLLSFVWPDVALVTLVLLYGVFVLADGVCALMAAVLGRPAIAGRWWLIIVGLLGIAAGVLTLMLPGITALVLLFCIAAWAVVTGILQIIGAILLRKEIENEWFLILTGVLSLIFGIALILMPGAGILGLIWLVAAYAIAYGFAMIAFSFRLRRLKARAR
jgi:uncharacterized membrane protein HdeD (DUF308 family)